MGAKINLSNTAGELQQDANGNAMVNLPRTRAQAGYGALLTEVHDGASGAARKMRNLIASQRFRMRAGLDSLVWDDNFNFSTTNTRKYNIGGTAMTGSQGGGSFTLNNGSSVATGTGYIIRTYSTFTVPSEGSLTITAAFSLALNPQTNNEINIGLFLPNTAITTPNDGIYMQVDNTGSLRLVANFAGSIISSAAAGAFTLSSGVTYMMRLVINREFVELWINDILYAELQRVVVSPSAGSLSATAAGFLGAQLRNTSTTAGAQKLNIYSWSVHMNDYEFGKSFSDLAADRLDHALSATDGQTVAMLTGITNSAAEASATLSNVSAGYAKLGGNWQFAAVAGSETDYALFAYLVPAFNASTLPARSLVIKGIEIDAFNMGAAVATTPTLLSWYLGIGSTAISLATTDTGTTRAPHRFALGSQSFPVGSAIGARADRAISVNFSAAPLVVDSNSYVHIILRIPVGTATASQIIRGSCGIIGHFK